LLINSGLRATKQRNEQSELVVKCKKKSLNCRFAFYNFPFLFFGLAGEKSLVFVILTMAVKSATQVENKRRAAQRRWEPINGTASI